MFSTWEQKAGRPDFHVSQYHILPGCLTCSDAEFPLEIVSFREASQLCRSANHSCFSIQMLETASSKLLPGAQLPVGNCIDISSSDLLPVPPDLEAGRCHPLLLRVTPQGWLLVQARTGKIQSDNSELSLRTGSLRSCVYFRPISNDFIADEDAQAMCKLSELSSLPVSGSRLCSVSRLMLGTDVHRPAVSPVHPALTCLHNLYSLHSQGTGSEDPCIVATSNTHGEARLDVSFTNWVMRPREMKNSCRS